MCCRWRSGLFEELECLVCKLARDKIIEGLAYDKNMKGLYQGYRESKKTMFESL